MLPEELLCQFAPSTLLVISENVFDPLIYYSHALAGIPALILGVLVFFAKREAIQNKIFFLLTVLFSIWVLFDQILWASEKKEIIMFTWSTLIFIGPLITALCYYFVHVFVKQQDVPFWQQLVFIAAFIPVLLFAHTTYNLEGYDLTNCDREAPEGMLWTYTYYLQYVLTALIAVFLVWNFKNVERARRRNVLLAGLGVILFLIAFTSGNYLGSITEDWRYEQYGFFGMPIFLALLAYGMSTGERRIFNIKIIGANVLVLTLWGLVAGILLIQDLALIRTITSITLALVLVLGVLLIRSVRKEVKTREALEIANARLRELDKQKSEFVSFASHQLRSPLTAMKGYAANILEGDYGKITDGVKSAITAIFEGARTLTAVVDDYLNVSRIELGTMKYDFQDTDFKELVDGCVRELRPNIESSGLKFGFNAESGNYLVRADGPKLNQVVCNIIDNSMKYTKQGSITLNLKHDGGKLAVLAVKDTGIGASKATISKLFQKFSRGEGGTQVNTKGTGLGLFIAREIAKAHKGDVWMESEGEGKGATFFVKVPLKK